MSTFFDRLNDIDGVIRRGPNEENAIRLKELAEEPASQRYLFEKLDAHWLQSIRAAGWFADPPSPVQTQRGSYFAMWPASRYLREIAREQRQEPNIAELIRDIVFSITLSDNPYVFEDLVDVALALPISVAVELSFLLQSWIGRQRTHFSGGTATSSLINRFASEGQFNAAFRIFQALFTVYPDLNFYQLPEEKRLLPKPQSHLRTWEYGEQLAKTVDQLGKRSDVRLIWILCKLLNDAIRYSRKEFAGQGPDDYSFVWRPAIEEHAQNRRDSLEDSLVTALRAASEALIRQEPRLFRDILDILGVQQWFVFARIILHLLRVCGSAPLDTIAEYICNETYFQETSVRHEYALLLKTRFRQLDKERQEAFLRFVAKGPDVNAFVQRMKMWDGSVPNASLIERHVRHWKFEWLNFVKDDLNADWQATFRDVSQGFEPPKHPEFPTYVESGSYALQTPITVDALLEKSVPEIVSFLNNWKAPKDDWDAGSTAGLAGVLTQAVGRNPGLFLSDQKVLEQLQPAYFRALIDGFGEAVKKGASFDWQKVLDLCQFGAIPNGSANRGEEPWLWAQRSIVSLIEEGLNEQHQTRIPFELRETVWRVIQDLAKSNESVEGEEQLLQDGNFDPVTRSLNTVKGTALQTAIRYGLWVKKSDAQFAGMSSIPELGDLLDSELELTSPPLFSIRAIFGQWFPWLTALDEKWAEQRVGQIFPEADQQDDLWQAAWTAYIGYCAPYDKVFEILGAVYARAVKQISREWKLGTGHLDPSERLAEHLMTFYWRGKLNVEDPLLVNFVRNSKADTQERSLEFIGRSLGNTAEVPPEIARRLQVLFDWFVENAPKPTADAKLKQFSAFGWWFMSQVFPDQWRIERLKTALTLAGDVDPVDKVLENLEDLSTAYPAKAAECVALLASSEHDYWELDYWNPMAFKVLESARKSNWQEAKPWILQAANSFGRAGFVYFRSLIGEPYKPAVN